MIFFTNTWLFEIAVLINVIRVSMKPQYILKKISKIVTESVEVS